jgi:release factor glutamine methyltransferase
VTYHDLVVAARATLERAGIAHDIARLDADLLARHALAWDHATWLTRRHERASDEFASRYTTLIQRREAREPVAYIRGVQEFWGREFIVTPAVLIPRPETELLIEIARPLLSSRSDAVVADIGTGSGCLAVTLALEHPGIVVYATETSSAALDVARENARRFEVGWRIRFIHGRYLDDVPPPIDVILSNPPYVRLEDEAGLPPEVRRFEPAGALFAGEDGLRDIRAILRASPGILAPGGWLAFEIGLRQSGDVQRELQLIDGLELAAIHNDLQGIPRVVVTRSKTPVTL